MNGIKLRTVTLYKDYFSNFYEKQKQKVKDKILWTFRIIETQQQIPTDYFQHMEGTDGLFEIRIKQGSDIFRIFCFFDEVKTNCIGKLLSEKDPENTKV